MPVDQVIDRLFELAETCLAQGMRPMPALIASGSAIVVESLDLVFAERDPTMHGEMAAIRSACRQLGQAHLRGLTLYSFGEPCLMCCGAIHWAKLDAVVFCLSQAALQSLSGGRSKPGVRAYLPHGGRPIGIHGPVREEQAVGLARRYDWTANGI